MVYSRTFHRIAPRLLRRFYNLCAQHFTHKPSTFSRHPDDVWSVFESTQNTLLRLLLGESTLFLNANRTRAVSWNDQVHIFHGNLSGASEPYAF